jgi:hypothetical protein
LPQWFHKHLKASKSLHDFAWLSTENLNSKSLSKACIKHRASIRRREPSYYTVEREREREKKRSEGKGKTLQIPWAQMAAFFAFRSLRSQLQKASGL